MCALGGVGGFLGELAILEEFFLDINPRTSGGGLNGPPIGFSDLKFETFKQSK